MRMLLLKRDARRGSQNLTNILWGIYGRCVGVRDVGGGGRFGTAGSTLSGCQVVLGSGPGRANPVLAMCQMLLVIKVVLVMVMTPQNRLCCFLTRATGTFSVSRTAEFIKRPVCFWSLAQKTLTRPYPRQARCIRWGWRGSLASRVKLSERRKRGPLADVSFSREPFSVFGQKVISSTSRSTRAVFPQFVVPVVVQEKSHASALAFTNL